MSPLCGLLVVPQFFPVGTKIWLVTEFESLNRKYKVKTYHDLYGSSDTWSHALEIAQWSVPQSSPEVICHRQDAVQKRAWM